MKPSEVFGVVIRAIGLVVVVWAVGILGFALMNLVGGGPASVVGLSIIGIPVLLFGLWLLRGAPAVVRFAYPSRLRDEFGRLRERNDLDSPD